MEHVFFVNADSGRVVGRNTYDGAAPQEITAPKGERLFRSSDPALAEIEPQRLIATIQGGEVTAVKIDPNYTPPDPPVPLEEQIADLKARIDKNLQVSPHDRRWLEQKEVAKEAGIAYIKANPECTIEEMDAALRAQVASQFPGEPIVVSSGLIMSYADEAQKRGYIPKATWEALKALVTGATEKQLRRMLNKL